MFINVYRLDDLPSIKMCLDLSSSYLLAADSKRAVSSSLLGNIQYSINTVSTHIVTTYQYGW